MKIELGARSDDAPHGGIQPDGTVSFAVLGPRSGRGANLLGKGPQRRRITPLAFWATSGKAIALSSGQQKEIRIKHFA
jgi:hypothetical protein